MLPTITETRVTVPSSGGDHVDSVWESSRVLRIV